MPTGEVQEQWNNAFAELQEQLAALQLKLSSLQEDFCVERYDPKVVFATTDPQPSSRRMAELTQGDFEELAECEVVPHSPSPAGNTGPAWQSTMAADVCEGSQPNGSQATTLRIAKPAPIDISAIQVVDMSENPNEVASLEAPDDEDMDDIDEDAPQRGDSVESLEEATTGGAQVDGAFGSIFASKDLDLESPPYHVEDFYYTDGWCQAIARSERFNSCTLLVIVANAIYLGIDSDHNSAETLYDAHAVFVLCEHLFCLYFTFELMVRFASFENKKNCLRDGWFRFDSVLVGDMVLGTWVIATIDYTLTSGNLPIPGEPLRLLRLLRLTRITRLMRNMPELCTLTKGLLLAFKAALSSLIMVGIMVYIFGIIMHLLMKNEDSVNASLDATLGRSFANIPNCMWVLLLDGAWMLDAGVVMTKLLSYSTFNTTMACLMFMLFVMVTAMMILNMLIGVMCEVVAAVDRAEKDESAVAMIKDSLFNLLHDFDDGDGLLTHAEVEEVMRSKTARKVFRELNVDELFATELLTTLFKTKKSRASIKGVMKLMLMCRGDLNVTVEHMSSGQAFLAAKIDRLDSRLTAVYGSRATPVSPKTNARPFRYSQVLHQ